jgi:cephalosporin hydroxylase
MNPNDIPGWINPTHQTRLAHHVSQQKPGAHILEVGCGFGRSTITILNHLPEGAILHTVDTYENLNIQGMVDKHYRAQKRKGIKITAQLEHNLNEMVQRGQKGFWDYVIAQHHRAHQVTAHQMTSEQYRSQFGTRTYDMVWLDGDHTYEGVRAEIEHYQSTPTLCGDDYTPTHSGVIQAVDEFRNQHPDRSWEPPQRKSRSGFWCIKKHS